ncbi:MAG: NAD(+) synthase, partial [Clostridia bacterium]|nr:NAD(+) synthase [Clostridia bacterium]
MKDGFIKCGAGTPKIIVGDCMSNAKEIVRLIKQADEKGIKLLALPELCVSGYTCGDLFLQDALLDGVERAIEYILKESKRADTVVAFGAPLRNKGKLFNCAVVIYKGEIIGVTPKINIPEYGEFYEARHFASGRDMDYEEIEVAGNVVQFGQLLYINDSSLRDYAFGVEICEDLWVADSPSIELCKRGARIILNLSASNEVVGKSEYRRNLVAVQSGKLDCAYVYASAGDGESTTDTVFAGHNVIAESGNILAESKLFSNSLIYTDIDVKKLSYERRRKSTVRCEEQEVYAVFGQKLSDNELTRKFSPTPFVPSDEERRSERCELILDMQANGMKKRIEHTNSQKLVIGLSGGLDSALALLVTAKAIDILKSDRKDILAVTMPCFGTTKRTKSNAEV